MEDSSIDSYERQSVIPESSPHSIAIVGIGCRFPGGANSPEAFWDLLQKGSDAISLVPNNRWDIDLYYAPDAAAPGKMHTRWGGFIEDIDRFDSTFFGIAPREAVSMDPQQRLLLEVACESIENAGISMDRLKGSQTGVFVGISSNDYGSRVDFANDAWSKTGNAFSVAAGRLSYLLGLKGPSMAVDTSSSSSLVAVHLACQNLRLGECDVALAGGVNVILSPEGTLSMSRLGVMAGDGRCKTFDARADGYVRAEGCGIVVLKRLSDAQRDADRIWAVIRGSAVNQDGRSTSLTAPHGPSQEALLMRALSQARVLPSDVDYVECHGTGTPLGDRTELQALGTVLKEGRPPDRPVIVGSVKTQIGHCEAAAGIAGLIKVALCLKHTSIPANLHFHEPNPGIPWEQLPVRVPLRLLPWPAKDTPRIAGVSSFGISGTNAHLVVQESLPASISCPAFKRPVLLPLSAHTQQALKSLAGSWRDDLKKSKPLWDMVYTASVRRTHHGHRLAVTGKSRGELILALDAFLKGKPNPGLSLGHALSESRTRVVFVFSGQGSHWPGMGRGLLEKEPVFRTALESCDEAIRKEAGWSVLEEIQAGDSACRFHRQDIIQPVFFALEVGLAALWRSWGIEPDVIVGHSMGEVAGAYVAGILSLDDAVRVICRRSRLMQRASGSGGMAVAELSGSETERRLAVYEGRLSVAALNSPRSTVVSGDRDAVDSFLAQLEAEGIFYRRMKVGVACHSPHMEPLKNELEAALSEIAPLSGNVPFLSTVTGETVNGPDLDALYWGRNLREPVQFQKAVEKLETDAPAIYLEVSPHPVLSAAIESILNCGNKAWAGRVIPSLRRDQPEQVTLLKSLGRLYAKGYPVSWQRLYPTGNVVSLPSFPWQRERFWIESPSENRKIPSSNTKAMSSKRPRSEEITYSQTEYENLLLEVEWRLIEPLSESPRSSAAPGYWVFLSDTSGVAESLAKRLEARGDRIVHVTPTIHSFQTGTCRCVNPNSPQGFSQLFGEISKWDLECRGIVHLWGLSALQIEGIESFKRAQELGSLSVIRLVHSLATVPWRTMPRLWLVTRGLKAMSPSLRTVPLGQAPLWGLGQAIVMEHPELQCTRIDLSPRTMTDETGALLQEIESRAGEEAVALRPEGRYAARLVQHSVSDIAPARAEEHRSHVYENATYIVAIGGVESEGISVALLLLKEGARHLVLLINPKDRSPQWLATLAELEASEAKIVTMELDISDRSQLRSALDRIGQTMPPLRGIVHAGRDLADKKLLELEPDGLFPALIRSAAGAWNLHELTLDTPLDFFVICSSAASLLGSPGCGCRAMRDAFFDALTSLRLHLDRPAVHVYWNVFTKEGFEIPESRRRFSYRGLGSLTPEQAGQIFNLLLSKPQIAHIGVAPLNVRQWVECYPQAASSSLLSGLMLDSTQLPGPGNAALRRSILAALPRERQRLMEDFLQDRVAQVLGMDTSRVDRRTSFKNLGLDSLMGLELRNCLEMNLGLELSATLLWTYPDVTTLSDCILRLFLSRAAESVEDKSPDLKVDQGDNSTLAAETMQLRVEIEEARGTEPIAIVGLGCRFPGGANDPETFWKVLEGEVDVIEEIPESRGVRSESGESGVLRAGLLDSHLFETFDNTFFGISPREAVSLDPQQRMLLEVAWEALENAGQPPDRLMGSPTGVFVGMWTQDYAHLVNSMDPSDRDAYCLTGNIASVAAGRLAYILGLQGPCMTVDTACSSSLVAVHLAVASLRNKECEAALAGGVNLILSEAVMDGLVRTHALSPDGRCKTFDARANGYVRSEGCGIVVLKRLSAAKRDGDRIWAVIRGSAVNQDGRSSGLTAPNVLSQQKLLRSALENSGVAPGAIGCIEAHGTGTSLGDPIEVEALKAVFGNSDTPCFLGSVKSNIGHTEAAAGAAGLIKVVLAMKHRMIPRLLHFQSLNPRIQLSGTRFLIPKELQPWPSANQPRMAGVSAFGISGTNAHVVVEEAPSYPAFAKAVKRPALLLPLSAHRPEALKALARAWIEAAPDSESLWDMLYTASVRRSHHEYRLAIAGKDTDDLIAGLRAFVEDRSHPGLAVSREACDHPPRIVFVFPGQGGQWPGMGRELLANEPVFREAMKACDEAVRKEAGWSVLEVLHSDASASGFDQVEIVQPVLFAIQVALAALWRSWGIEPDVIVGHSMGEVAGAYVAGALNLEDSVRVICRRSELMHRASGLGGMAVLDLSVSETQQRLALYEGRLSIAASNSHRSTVVSGDLDALDAFLARMEAEGTFCRRVKVDMASHSHHMEPLKSELETALKGIRPMSGGVAVLSTVTGERMEGSAFDAAYWGRNLREPVQFAKAVEQLAAAGSAIYVEISPHPVLSMAIQSMLSLENGASAGVPLPSLRKDQLEQTLMFESLGRLYALGYPVAWERLYPAGKVASLPTYPWQRERFWIDASSRNRYETTRYSNEKSFHPLLGVPSTVADRTDTRFWESVIDPARIKWIPDHRVEDMILLPGAAYLDMAISAARIVFGQETAITLEDVAFREALIFESGPRCVQLVWTDEGPDQASFSIFSKQPDGDAWTLHASGRVRRELESCLSATSKEISLSDICNRLGEPITTDAFYAWFLGRGQNYGPTFHGIKRFWINTEEALAEVRLPEPIAGQASRYFMHPSLLDGCLQIPLAALHRGEKTSGATVPTRIESMRVLSRPETGVWGYTRLGAQGLEGDIYVLDTAGEPLMEIKGVCFQPLGHRRDLKAHSEWFLRKVWEPIEQSGEPSDSSSLAGLWMLLSDSAGVAASLAASMEMRGAKVIQVVPAGEPKPRTGTFRIVDPTSPEAFDDLLEETLNQTLPFKGIVHCWSLSTPETNSLASLERAQEIILGSTIHLLQALARKAGRDSPRLWLVTRGAQAVGRYPETINLAQSPLWGLARTISMEYPALRCTRLDLDPKPLADEAKALMQELVSSGEEEIALRADGRYSARLMRAAPDSSISNKIHASAKGRPVRPAAEQRAYRQVSIAMPAPAGNLIRGDGTYLITGGLGGLGLKAANWLVAKGARHLVLLSRHGCTTSEQCATIEELGSAGAEIEVIAADVADPAQMSDALAGIRTKMPPLRGIIHAAGLLDDALLPRQSLARLHSVMAPKLAGAWNLHTLSENDPLDFFVLYSSVATVLGLPGLANYAAANAFLDALAHLRHIEGRPALSISWGNFAQVGMAARDSNRGDRLVHQGLENLTPEQGISILEDLLTKERSPQIGVIPINMQKWAEFHPQVLMSSLMSYLVEGTNKGEQAEDPSSFLHALMNASHHDRQERMEAFVRDRVGQVLRMDPSRIDSKTRFKTLGIDSLMVLEIRYLLETGLKLRLPATLLWTHPNVVELAKYLNGVLIPQDSIPSDLPAPSPKKKVGVRLFCFPYGGGDASIYAHWSNQLAPEIEVCPFQYPGRKDSLSKEPARNFLELVEEAKHFILRHGNEPFAIYGHSMGALLAFEVTRQLRRKSARMPVHLFLSAYLPPHKYLIQSLLSLDDLSDEGVLQISKKLVPNIGRLDNKEYIGEIIPLLRSDYSLARSYEYMPEAPLHCPFSVFGGFEDEVVRPEHLWAWQDLTSGKFQLRMIQGDHLFLHPSWETIVEAIREDLELGLCCIKGFFAHPPEKVA